MEGWLTRIATNTCLNLIRSAKRRPELTVSDLTEDENKWLDDQLLDVASEPRRSVEETFIAADLADRVLAVLPPEDQMALLMIDGEDASVKEVAEATGWSESKVKVRAFRARKKLREAMEKLLSNKGKIGRPVNNEG
jgi:RNA polymerase sigma-70 factor (ECF subfamily)